MKCCTSRELTKYYALNVICIMSGYDWLNLVENEPWLYNSNHQRYLECIHSKHIFHGLTSVTISYQCFRSNIVFTR